MDWGIFWTAAGSITALASMMYLMARNFKADMCQRFEKIDQRFEKMDQRFDKIEQRFEKIDQRFKAIDEKLEGISSRLDRLEVRVEERTFRNFYVEGRRGRR